MIVLLHIFAADRYSRSSWMSSASPCCYLSPIGPKKIPAPPPYHHIVFKRVHKNRSALTHLHCSQLPLVDCSGCKAPGQRLLLLGVNPGEEREVRARYIEQRRQRWCIRQKRRRMLDRRMDGGRRYEREERRQRDDWARVERRENKSAGMERETGLWVARHRKGTKGKLATQTNPT